MKIQPTLHLELLRRNRLRRVLSSNCSAGIASPRDCADICRRRVHLNIGTAIWHVAHPRKRRSTLNQQTIPRVSFTNLSQPSNVPTSLITGLIGIESTAHCTLDLGAKEGTGVTAPTEPVLIIITVLGGGDPDSVAARLSCVATHVDDEVCSTLLTFLESLFGLVDDYSGWWKEMLIEGGTMVRV